MLKNSLLTSASHSINISVQETGHDFDAGSVRKLSACGAYSLLQRDNGVTGEVVSTALRPVQKSLDTHNIERPVA